jgi:hypothetical protein
MTLGDRDLGLGPIEYQGRREVRGFRDVWDHLSDLP